MPTLRDIANDVILMLSQAGVTGVQTYSSPQIKVLINQCFKMLLDRQWWPDYMDWFRGTLDGSSGVVVEDIAVITRYMDVRAVFPSGSNAPLPRLPNEIDPFNISGTNMLFIDGNAQRNTEKVFRVWPLAAIGTISIHARLKPDTYTDNDEIIFDDLALSYGAAWAYAEDDGTNPGASQKFQTLFENRVKDLEAALNDKPVALNNVSVQIPNQWWIGN